MRPPAWTGPSVGWWTRTSAPLAALFLAMALVWTWSPTPGGYPEAAFGGGLVQVNTAHLFLARDSTASAEEAALSWRRRKLATFGWTNRSLVQTTSLSFRDFGGVIR